MVRGALALALLEAGTTSISASASSSSPSASTWSLDGSTPDMVAGAEKGVCSDLGALTAAKG